MWGEGYDDEKLPKSSNPRLIATPEEFDYALFELCWHLQDCTEAVEVFSNFEECPVCLCRAADSGVMIHKDPKLLLN
jgi:hypothetical protein